MVVLNAWLLFALLPTVRGQSQSQSLTVITQTDTSVAGLPTDSRATYQSVSTTIIQSASSPVSLSGSIIISGSSTGQSNGTASATSTVGSYLTITGASRSSTTSSGTSTAPAPTNTQPCNNYVEFCNRKYSNVTEIAAHNSPFNLKNTIFSNQQLDVKTQLNDGVRMLQVQGHVNATTKVVNLCHSSCDFLNAGTLEAWLRDIVDWLNDNRYEVVTILIGNYGYEEVKYYEEPIRKSGILPYLYVPPKIPMGIDDWPTLGSMILTGKRVVFMMDYQANQTAVPYILDEFIHMWETPFSPTSIAFPCTVERPPALPADQARQRMYMANHNLNVKIYIPGLTSESNPPLVPNVAQLNKINGVEGEGSLGLMANNCRSEWTRPPTFLLVDYYNIGSYNGSVFEVAAQMNNVTYNRKCCGKTSDAAPKVKVYLAMTTLAMLYFVLDCLSLL